MDYELLEAQVRGLTADEPDYLANAANFASFIYHELPDLNWSGFYYADQANDLVLGPFHGKPACTRLPAGRGVCGAAYTSNQTVVVEDVNAFGDHIVCDTASRSEIVVPLADGEGTYGVFDIDSPSVGRFSESDRRGIERLVAAFIERFPRRPQFLERHAR